MQLIPGNPRRHCLISQTREPTHRLGPLSTQEEDNLFKVPLVVSAQRSKNSYPNRRNLRPHAVFSGPGVPGTLDLLADLITSVSSLPHLGHLPWNKFRVPPPRKSLRLLLLPCPELTAVAENIKPPKLSPA